MIIIPSILLAKMILKIIDNWNSNKIAIYSILIAILIIIVISLALTYFLYKINKHGINENEKLKFKLNLSPGLLILIYAISYIIITYD